jgi:hypothetical protein
VNPTFKAVRRFTSGLAVTRPEHGQLGFFCLDWSMGASAIYYH